MVGHLHRSATAAVSGSFRDTVFAVSTAPGVSAIAVIRVSGPDAGRAVECLAGRLPRPRMAAFRRLSHGGEELDEALVLWFPGPRSETGEDLAEFHVHGGRAVVSGVLGALYDVKGLRPAQPGEFTRRAFANGKIDLTKVEAIADLVAAETAAQRTQAVRQMSGALSNLYDGWREDLVGAMALIEAGIDFGDEADVPADAWDAARAQLGDLAEAMTHHLADRHRGERLREGGTVVIAGPPNAGKSSLINALARRDVAIVSSEAGTTRDVLEVSLDLGGVPVRVMDTAGLRESCDGVEAEGVRRARVRMSEADLVLWLRDASEPDAPGGCVAGDGEVWEIRTKGDLARSADDGLAMLTISVVDGSGLGELEAALGSWFGDRFVSGTQISLTRERHRRGVEDALAAIRDALLCDFGGRPEVAAESLRAAAWSLGRIVGHVDVEEVLDAVFSEFCIGK